MAKEQNNIVKFRPAGKDDTFTIVGTDINNIVEKERFVMKASQKGVKMEALSTELTENMVIKAENNIVSLADRKAEKEQDDRDVI